MLKNIRLHIEKDEEKQAELDNELASQILENRKNNINAFRRNIPSLSPLIQGLNLTNYSVFMNKFSEPNIVDYGLGRTFYGFHPKDEVLQQLNDYKKHSLEVPLEQDERNSGEACNPFIRQGLNTLSGYKNRQAQQPLPEHIECLVVLGCGLGLHILPLLQQHVIKYLIIYEPEAQFFQCSMMTTQWQDIFAQAKINNTAIFLQLEKDARDIVSDINQLVEHNPITSFHLYKHYNHQVFESVYHNLSNRSWADINENGLTIESSSHFLNYVPLWTPNIDLNSHSLLEAPNDKLSNNLEAFKKFFPDIYEQYKDYEPKKWHPIVSPNGEVNLVKIDSLHAWYSDHPKQDCALNFESFGEQPNKDGLVLGYSGTKLAHYIHYQFVKETGQLLKQSEEEVGALPDNVASIIMFGLGVGYQLETLLDEHTVEKLFICEPNPDFFYASLFAIDWQTLFEAIEESDSRIYLNIGDDGTHLFKDLLSQFHSIGPYILNSTYFYQSYYNSSLNSAISQLREQLQVVISMGEYFDHAYYGIAQTKEGMKRQIPVLSSNPSDKLSYDDKEVPIFIVGNGPSLDTSIEAIKEWKEQSIVVSCGTSLQALHRHKITPDFHAEIEQNRSTFDWAVMIGDLDYLKRITLISCNGIHPDTCSLYKDVLIAFKEGESSTVSALNILGQENFEVLQNAFPTVSNFVCNLFSKLGFTSVYLLGVDLGFVDVNHHHSKSSGYYKEGGKETYDYSETVNTSLVVPGNFRSQVNTKHEFKISKQVIEQVTSSKPKQQAFYNCSDGAKIDGTMPTRIDDLLIVATSDQKNQAVKQLKQTVFSTSKIPNFVERFEKAYSHEKLMKELSEFEQLIEESDLSKTDISPIIDKQKEMLFNSYKTGQSLLFYYLYGTVNYANAAFIKLANIETDKNNISPALGLAMTEWLQTIQKITLALAENTLESFDTSSFRIHTREPKLLALRHSDEKLLIVTDSKKFKRIIKYYLETTYPWLDNINILTSAESLNYKEIPNYSVYYQANEQNIIKGRDSTVILTTDAKYTDYLEHDVSYLSIPAFNKKTVLADSITLIHIALRYCLGGHKSAIVFPKTYAADISELGEQDIEIPVDDYYVYDYLWYLCVYPKSHDSNIEQTSNHGSRGKRLLEKFRMKHLIQNVISPDDMRKIRQDRSISLKKLRKQDK